MCDYEECQKCQGLGFITHCPDDLCQGEDGCIHGDDEVCLACAGSGDVCVEDDYDDAHWDDENLWDESEDEE